MLAFLLWAFAVWQMVAVLATISLIGKPRGPITPGSAVCVTAIGALLITVLISAALALS